MGLKGGASQLGIRVKVVEQYVTYETRILTLDNLRAIPMVCRVDIRIYFLSKHRNKYYGTYLYDYILILFEIIGMA